MRGLGGARARVGAECGLAAQHRNGPNCLHLVWIELFVGERDVFEYSLCETGGMLAWAELEAGDGLRLRVIAGDSGLRAIEFEPEPIEGERNDSHPLLGETVRQLREYFDGTRREFALPLELQGTDFQRRVWEMLLTIPYGETRSYRELAQAIGAPKAVRAVGAANGANPLPIVVPCHRVIGANGKLTGYGGGLPLKKRLLELEKQTAQRSLWQSA